MAKAGSTRRLRARALRQGSEPEEARRRAGAKDAAMLPPAEAERITGYHVGGISPFGQKKRAAVFIEEAALAHATVIVNGGRRGLQIEIAAGRTRAAARRESLPPFAERAPGCTRVRLRALCRRSCWPGDFPGSAALPDRRGGAGSFGPLALRARRAADARSSPRSAATGCAFGAARPSACFALLGLALFCMNFLLFYYAAHYLPSGLLAVIFSLASFINVVARRAVSRRCRSTGASSLGGAARHRRHRRDVLSATCRRRDFNAAR